MTSITINIEGERERRLRERVEARGVEDAEALVGEVVGRWLDGEEDVAGEQRTLTRGEQMVEQMRGTATRRVRAEEIYEFTRSDL